MIHGIWCVQYMGNQERYKSTCIIKTKMGGVEAEGSHPIKNLQFSRQTLFSDVGLLLEGEAISLGKKQLAKPWSILITVISPTLPQRDLWSLTEETEHSRRPTPRYFETCWMQDSD